MVGLEVECGRLARACGIALSFLRIVGLAADLHGGLSQAPKHHGNLLPACHSAWSSRVPLVPGRTPVSQGHRVLSSARGGPLLACRMLGTKGLLGLGPSPPTLPRQTLPRVLRHSLPPTGAALAHSPTNPTSQCPHPAVVPACSVVTSIMFNSWLGVGMDFPRKGRIPLGSCPVPACLPWAWNWD